MSVGVVIQAIGVVTVCVGRDCEAAQNEDLVGASVWTTVDIGMRNGAVIFIPYVIDLQIRTEHIGWIPLQRCTAYERFQSAAVTARAVGQECRRIGRELHIVLDILELRRQANTQRVGNRAGNVAANGRTILLKLLRYLHADFPVWRRVRRSYRKHASRRTLSEEQRLRTLQHFNLGDIKKAGLHDPHRADLDAIEIERHGGVERCGDIG